MSLGTLPPPTIRHVSSGRPCKPCYPPRGSRQGQSASTFTHKTRQKQEGCCKLTKGSPRHHDQSTSRKWLSWRRSPASTMANNPEVWLSRGLTRKRMGGVRTCGGSQGGLVEWVVASCGSVNEDKLDKLYEMGQSLSAHSTTIIAGHPGAACNAYVPQHLRARARLACLLEHHVIRPSGWECPSKMTVLPAELGCLNEPDERETEGCGRAARNLKHRRSEEW
ncbi:hypothetical protein F4780DRAFT_250822 [Xylariomycetidae sp. FL0641]|nr:hypothetical protein F4780DRAFT_250822 [Xylariomycetidae sp. FL0641]